MAESLLIKYALLAQAHQFLIDLQKYQLQILKGDGMIDRPEKFKFDVL